MKFSVKKMLVSGLLTGALTFCAAGAANFESTAKSLNEIGLLSGTESGFDLDRASTRGEAAAMLVRLLGKEDEAAKLWQDDAADFSFTDMEDSAWAKPSVNWLVENGLAAGTTDTTFAPREQCSAQMAATFLLRALGYSDAAGGDFTYATAMDFARQKGVVDLVNCDEKDFRRDHFVAMCYTALSLQPKTGEADLLSKLVADGVIADNDTSKALRQHFADYRDYNSANQNLSKANAVAMQMDASIAMAMGSEKIDLGLSQALAVKADPAKPEEMEMSMTGSINMAVSAESGNETASIPNAMYFKDGIAYVDAGGEKMKTEMDIEDALAQASVLNMQGVSGEPITAITSLTKSAADGKTTYSIAYNAAVMENLVDTILGGMMASVPELGEETIDIAIDSINVGVTLDAQGMLEKMNMDLAMTVGDGETDITMQMKADIAVTATGDAVKIDIPDLSEFESTEGLANAPAPSAYSGGVEEE